MNENLTETPRRSVRVALSIHDTHATAKPHLKRGVGPRFLQKKAVVKRSCRHSGCADLRHFAEHPVIGIGWIESSLFVVLIPLCSVFDREHELEQSRAQTGQIKIPLLPVQTISTHHEPVFAGRGRP